LAPTECGAQSPPPDDGAAKGDEAVVDVARGISQRTLMRRSQCGSAGAADQAPVVRCVLNDGVGLGPANAESRRDRYK
jgi:hypothetical protein